MFGHFSIFLMLKNHEEMAEALELIRIYHGSKKAMLA